MSDKPVPVRRTGIRLTLDSRRVFLRAFYLTNDHRHLEVIARIGMLSEDRVVEELNQVLIEFEDRHHDAPGYFLRRFEQMKYLIPTDEALSDPRKRLIGAYFTLEYSLESAALFNPSMVWHPDQSDISKGSRRFVLSLRATGEGHLSSIAFRTGVVDSQNQVAMDAPTRFVSGPESLSYPVYERALFERTLPETDRADESVKSVLGNLADTFTLEDLKNAIQNFDQRRTHLSGGAHDSLQGLLTLARANYEVDFSPEIPLCERVLFPTSPTEQNGIEDARFVEFEEENGKKTYYATYTAYNGVSAVPQILQTTDFLHFKMSTLNGPEVKNKGMALFPRKINGLYAMLSRQDNENVFLMYSENLHFWFTKSILLKPTYPWEFVQLGNCGSPIELKEGWLVLTHGVGAMRKYALGAVLLDLKDPQKVLGRLREPLLAPDASEREGYVPNVVYSCGAQVHHGDLILPYAMSDSASSFAVVPVKKILAAME